MGHGALRRMLLSLLTGVARWLISDVFPDGIER
jgi:hypothetical protein